MANIFEQFGYAEDEDGNEQVVKSDNVFEQFGYAGDEPKPEPELEPGVGAMLRPAHEPIETAVPEPEERSLGQKTAAALEPYARPVLQAAGATAGGVLGALTPLPPPFGSIAGGSLGYATGEKAADTLAEYAGTREPDQTIGGMAGGIAGDLAEGAIYEAGGQTFAVVAGKLVPIAKKLASKIAKPAQTAAGKAVAQARTPGYAPREPNVAEAQAIEAEIPGTRFSEAQRTGDPGMIKLERARARQPGSEVAGMQHEQKIMNDEALRRYYEKVFGEKEGAEELQKALALSRGRLGKTAQSASAVAEERLSRLPAEAPETVGAKVIEKLKTQERAAREEASALYEKVPEGTPVDTEGLLNDIREIIKPSFRLEPPENVPPLLTSLLKEKAEGFTVRDLQGLRSELLSQARDARAGASPNRRLSARLTQAVNAVEDAIGYAGGKNPELFAANENYRRFSQTYRQGTVGDILKSGRRGETSGVPPSQVMTRIWGKGKESAADEFIKAVGPADAAEIATEHAAYELARTATTADGKISSKAFESWFRKNEAMLNKYKIADNFKALKNAQKLVDAAERQLARFEKSAASNALDADVGKAIEAAVKGRNTRRAVEELKAAVAGDPNGLAGLQKALADHIFNKAQERSLMIAGKPSISNAAFYRARMKYNEAMKALFTGPEGAKKIRAMNSIQKALEIASRTTRSPLGGGSDTAENVFSALGNVVNIGGPKMIVVRAAKKALGKLTKEQVDDLVSRALFDPELAYKLEQVYRGKSGEAASGIMNRVITGVLAATAEDDDGTRD
jgi:hypothetical protein